MASFPVKVLPMVPGTSKDDIRKTVSDILKRVDQLIKAGELDQSVRDIIRAKEIDPSNFYIHAYEERLAFLSAEHEKNFERERTRKEAEEAARKRDAEHRRQAEKEQWGRKEELERQEDKQGKQEKWIEAQQERPRDEETRQSSLQPTKSDSPEKLYVDAFTKAWSTGNITPQQAIVLQKLCRDLGISSERQLQIDAEIFSKLQSKPGPQTILVLEDDEQMLSLITNILIHHGFQVTGLTSSDEAYALLKQLKPRLILSDINLHASTMNGFGFYEKIQELDHLHDVPFVFLTGLTDEALIRRGKEIGVDDYLTKPVSEQDLVATVKGKLKRFRKLNGNSH